ncbi:hypothetical protein J3Q64DRAFT_1853649 [Phycomyces blakesleeanus]|uniref:Uncharacterized protein n=2 Tax=Phycomyces blakesleeanus TaxID=4837 RepID=A0A167JCH5_PHYB8|nr:hypothetical protein PHYBLDRAFT_153186 [Phycomyces blakesleeanus NRRL 1555(-)]OAD65709.1 hypothetical protein PHYBLDRAFT_153186 [Phycomyces blakesleeanus NRRL 1555(-)]|eukprot:XP_018283749.1 hypothetical protein PHYBLDRAFT_153186 [Phycomyces blakesleeanus NRRL 1555(-)]
MRLQTDLNAPFARRHGLPVQALALIFIDTLGNAAILLNLSLFSESVDSPQRSIDESILRALRQSGGYTCERNKALWIADSLKLQPFALLGDNQVEEIALTHCDNLMPLIAKSQDHRFCVKHVTAGKERVWDNSLISTNANSTTNIEANLMSIQNYGPYAQKLSKRCYKQLDINSCQLLNDD